MSSWISALKEYNDKKGSWCMPRKGSAEHAEVKAIMEKMKGKPATKAKAEPVADKPVADKPKTKLRTEKAKESEMMAKDRDAPEMKKTRKLKAKPVVQAESESDSDIPVAKPKARAEPIVDAKASRVAKAKREEAEYKKASEAEVREELKRIKSIPPIVREKEHYDSLGSSRIKKAYLESILDGGGSVLFKTKEDVQKEMKKLSK